jgi:hypothetical protein
LTKPAPRKECSCAFDCGISIVEASGLLIVLACLLVPSLLTFGVATIRWPWAGQIMLALMAALPTPVLLALWQGKAENDARPHPKCGTPDAMFDAGACVYLAWLTLHGAAWLIGGRVGAASRRSTTDPA